MRNLPGFARFLPIAALFHGQVVNTAGLARDAGVARTTVAGYLEILQDTHLVRMLPAYEARLRVKERKHPKLYWTDPGVVRVRRSTRNTSPTPRGGAPCSLVDQVSAAAAHGRQRSFVAELVQVASVVAKQTPTPPDSISTVTPMSSAGASGPAMLVALPTILSW